MTTVDFNALDERRRVDTVIERLRLGGKQLTTNVASQIIGADLEYGMETAYTLTLTLNDPTRSYVRSNELRDGYKAAVKRSDGPGWDKFALVSVSKTGDELSLVFEDEVVWRLRGHKGFDKVPRDVMTRAEFIYKMIREVTHPTIKFVSPQIFVKQPIAISEDTIKMGEDAAKDPTEGYGFKTGEKITIKEKAASIAQLLNMKKALDVGVRIRAPKTILVTVINIMIQESNALRGPMPGIADIARSAREFYRLATPIFAANREWEPWRIAYAVRKQGDAESLGRKTYGKWSKEARANVNAYLGTDAFGYKGSISRIQKQKFAKYEFTRGDLEKGEAENTWDAAKRLADEVGWRLYAYRNTVYFVNDDDLRTRPEWAKISEFADGVLGIDFGWDIGQPVSEVQVQLTAERFGAPPGSVIKITGCGVIVDKKRWLVTNFRRSLFDQIADLTLRTAVPPNSEPAPEVKSEKVNIDSGERVESDEGTVRGKIVEIAKKQTARTGVFRYAQVRPIPTTLEQNDIVTDCSGFTTMVYRQAGAPDPNGQGYNGQGYTGTQWSTGKAVAVPRPGDLVFYGSPSQAGNAAHVAIVINDREAVGFGGGNIPKRHSINYKPPAGFRSYQLGD